MVDRVKSIPHDAETAAVFGRAEDFAELDGIVSLRTLWVSGVRQPEMATIGRMPWLECLVIHDLRAPTLEALGALRALRTLRIAGSPKLKSLGGLEHLASLEELLVVDTCNYPTVRHLAGLIRLHTLCLEGGFSKLLSLDSLAPLASLTTLRRLRLASIRVADQSLRPLHGLADLRDVFVARTFPEGELRAAAKALPLARGRHFDEFR